MECLENPIYTTEQLLNEITMLKKQLEYETGRHKHWKSLAMIFHDSLWEAMGGKENMV